MNRDERPSMHVVHRVERRGISSLELLVAFGLLVAAMTSTVPLFVHHQRLLAESRRERIATEELANQAELVASVPAEEIEKLLAGLAPSELARRRLPDATLSSERGRSLLGERILLKLSWADVGRRSHPLMVAVWLPRAGDSVGVSP